jgi:hypothetical protein
MKSEQLLKIRKLSTKFITQTYSRKQTPVNPGVLIQLYTHLPKIPYNKKYKKQPFQNTNHIINCI